MAPDAAQGGRPSARRTRGTGLEAMVLPELKQLASSMGLKGTGSMRKGALIEAIKSRQAGESGSGRPANGDADGGRPANGDQRPADGEAAARRAPRQERATSIEATTSPTTTAPTSTAPSTTAPTTLGAPAGQAELPAVEGAPVRSSGRRGRRRDRSGGEDTAADTSTVAEVASSLARDFGTAVEDRADGDAGRSQERGGRADEREDRGRRDDRGTAREDRRERRSDDSQGERRSGDGQAERRSEDGQGERRGEDRQHGRGDDRQDRQQNRSQVERGGAGDYDDDGGGRRGRRRRNRDRQQNRRQRGGGGERFEVETTINEDDVLVDVSGILDVLDSYGFVRRSGYLPGPEDAYVPMSMVRKHGLRKGDVITGAIKAAREGDRKEKYTPLVRLDTVNGASPEQARNRPEFGKLTPLYPQERLRLETTATNMTNRIIDMVAPIGKGQRGLIVSPPKAGKTLVMQSIANAITTNNPEIHLMVVLVDERPEEVTDFQRTVNGEVIASTFDRPASDHTIVAELAIERAKRLVELGHDVVILLDGITRLGRAYNLAAPASGRILSGGVDSAALFPPKRFFGAARNIEDGGSLTILATALIETGSKMDEVIFEEFKGTGNMELRLRREFADKRIFPAVDVDASSTRREELLMSREELQIVWKLRRVLSGLDGQQALEMLLNRMRKTQTNTEFLMVISKTTPARPGDE
ncbi:transcription termination factor Rho [Auraticoccus sp. F435]|uniref:Transcription termination factor Rho n=2 Tax=Auraticoccus cholistanensis TaxID=2656650 RepID=A0A6A9UTS1_9ACTN|nr:transcription termination factor Rho [Auraticoccus cholistanensis]MVA76058.1 transcription termination factor Rho [Auraticoccus cholistanensis]